MTSSINPYKGRELLYVLTKTHPNAVKHSAQPLLDYLSSPKDLATMEWVRRFKLISHIRLFARPLFGQFFEQQSIKMYLYKKLRADGDDFLYTSSGTDRDKNEVKSINKLFEKLFNDSLSPMVSMS